MSSTVLVGVQYVRDVRNPFAKVISIAGSYAEGVEALLGGAVSVSQIENVTKMDQFFEGGECDMKLLFYNLGLLGVQEVRGDQVILVPVLERNPAELLDILTLAYKGEGPKIPDSDAQTYFSNQKALVERLYGLFPPAIEALRAQYASAAGKVLREHPVQDRLFQAVRSKLSHPRLFHGKEYHVGGRFIDLFWPICKSGEEKRREKVNFSEEAVHILPAGFSSDSRGVMPV